MLDKNRVIIDTLDIFVSLKRGLTLSDILFQLNNMYEPQGEKIDQELITEILEELSSNGNLKTFKVGAIDNWKITEDGVGKSKKEKAVEKEMEKMKKRMAKSE